MALSFAAGSIILRRAEHSGMTFHLVPVSMLVSLICIFVEYCNQ